MGRKAQERIRLVRQFISNPIDALMHWPRLQAWMLLVTAVLLAIDLVSTFIPDTVRWRYSAAILFILFCVIMYAHIRTICAQRDQARRELETDLEVLGYLKKDVEQLKRRVASGGDSTWTRAGEDLRIAHRHGVFSEGKHAALWSCIQVAENSPTTGRERAPGHAVFIVAVSLWEQQQDMDNVERTPNQRCLWGLGVLEAEIDECIGKLKAKAPPPAAVVAQA